MWTVAATVAATLPLALLGTGVRGHLMNSEDQIEAHHQEGTERPSLPDFRPAIGRAPRLANVYCGYGHQHVGLTLATATGRLIARQMEGQELPETLRACDPGRFG